MRSTDSLAAPLRGCAPGLRRRDLLVALLLSLGASGLVRAVGEDWRGKRAADFTLKTLGGKPVRLADFRGRTLLLNFWATWCAPCRVEMPWLVEFDARYRAAGLAILGVNVNDEDDRDGVAQFARERGVTYPIAFKDDAIVAAYGGIEFLPQTFFIARDGVILQRGAGISDKAAFEADVRAALNTSPRSE